MLDEKIIHDARTETTKIVLLSAIVLHIFTVLPNPLNAKTFFTVKAKGSKKAPKKCIDKSYLACAHHYLMVGALGSLPDSLDPVRCLLVGLGGGALPSFIVDNFKKVGLVKECAF